MTVAPRPPAPRGRAATLAARLAITAGAICLAAASPAVAATQIGETFVPDGADGAFCSGGISILQSISPAAQYTAPSAGVITSWSFRAGALPPRVRFKVGRFAGGDEFTIVGESDLVLPSSTVLNTFPARIPVLAGDVLGLYADTSGFCGRVAGGYAEHFASGDPPAGTTTAFTQEAGFQFDVAATLEADGDGDRFGDETQDRCPTDPSTQGTCPPVDATSPQVVITKARKRILTRRRSAQVRFEFSASEPRSSFRCALDRGRAEQCTSPYTARVRRGRHVFEVRAIDLADNVGTAVQARFRVMRRPRAA